MSHAYRYCQGPVRTRSGTLYEVFHHARGAPVLSAQGETLDAAWQALGKRTDHGDPDWRASPQLADALNLPAPRRGEPDTLQRDTALALAANAHGGATFAAIADADVRAACLRAFAGLADLPSIVPPGEAVLYDLRCAGSVVRGGVAVLLVQSKGATLAVVDDRNAAQRYLCARRGESQAAAPAFEAVTVRASSGWFALAMQDALGVAFDIDMERRRGGSTGPMLAAGAVLLGAISRGLPERPLSQPHGTGALATHALQSVCMLTRMPTAPGTALARSAPALPRAHGMLPGE